MNTAFQMHYELNTNTSFFLVYYHYLYSITASSWQYIAFVVSSLLGVSQWQDYLLMFLLTAVQEGINTFSHKNFLTQASVSR